jgi:hypothetical protein
VEPQPLGYELIESIDLVIATPIASMLFRQPVAQDLGEFASPSWLATDPANDRMNVWVAIGILMALRSGLRVHDLGHTPP